MRKFKMFTHVEDGDRASKVHFESEIGDFLRTHDAKKVDPESHNLDIVIVEKDFNNAELAAFNNAVTGFGRVEKVNMAYTRGVEMHLINADGSVPGQDVLKQALDFEIQRRVDAGTFT